MRGGRRRFAVLMAPAAIAAAAVTSGAPVRAAAPGEPVFTTTVAWSGGRHGEPSISVAGDQVYLAEPTGGDTLYRSLDGGATYETTRRA